MTTRFLMSLLALLAFSTASRADEVKIVEPADGATVIRRSVHVVAQVGSHTKVAKATLTASADRHPQVKYDLVPVAARPGCFSAEVKTPSRGKLELTVNLQRAARRRRR